MSIATYRLSRQLRARKPPAHGARRREKTLTEIERWRPRVPRMTLNEVRQAGFECWCKQREKQGDFDGTRFEDVKVYALDRWAVNWLRHEMTDYDQKLLDQRGKVGAPEAKVRVLEKVMGAIAEAYPSLANEALRQFAEKKEEGLGV